ncbi:hypothetical protein QNM99_04335 [Pseudomonas sp. PCH446]
MAPPLTEAPNSGLFGHGKDGSWSRIANLDSAIANQLVAAAQLGLQPGFLHEQRSIYTQISALISEALEKGCVTKHSNGCSPAPWRTAPGSCSKVSSTARTAQGAKACGASLRMPSALR